MWEREGMDCPTSRRCEAVEALSFNCQKPLVSIAPRPRLSLVGQVTGWVIIVGPFVYPFSVDVIHLQKQNSPDLIPDLRNLTRTVAFGSDNAPIVLGRVAVTLILASVAFPLYKE